MPAIRAISESSLLALTLLVTRIRADYEHDAAPPDNPAAVAHGLYGRSYFHRLALATYPIVLRGGPSGSMNRAAGTQKRPEGRTGSIAPGVVSPNRPLAPTRAPRRSPRLPRGSPPASPGSATGREVPEGSACAPSR